MKKKLVTLFAFITTALVLVACSVSVEQVVPPTAVTATDDIAPTALGKVDRYGEFLVTVPAGFDGDLVVFEAVGSGMDKIVVGTPSGQIIASSVSPYYFYPGFTDPTTADVSSQALPVSKCVGPCVYVPNTGETTKYVVEVTTQAEADFFAYATVYGDKGEPYNDRDNSAVELTLGNESVVEAVGAFETVNDYDYYKVDLSGNSGSFNVSFTGRDDSGVFEIAVEFWDENDGWVPLSVQDNNAKLTTFSGDLFRVYEKHGLAGSYDQSGYTVKLEKKL